MLRNVASTSLRQGQRVSTRVFQNHTTPQQRFLNTIALEQHTGDLNSVTTNNNRPSSNTKKNYKNRRQFSFTNKNKEPAPELQDKNQFFQSFNSNTQNSTVSSSTSTSGGSDNIHSSETSEYLILVSKFDNCLNANSRYDLSTGTVIGGSQQVWKAINQVMPIYRKLLEYNLNTNSNHLNNTNKKNKLDAQRIGNLVSLLRNGLRIERLELSKLKQNIDKDSNNPIKKIHVLLASSIREIANDVIDCKIKINSYGLTNIFKGYKDLGFSFEAVNIWKIGKLKPELHDLFLSESVLGSIFPFLAETNEFKFEELNEMYKNIKEQKLSTANNSDSNNTANFNHATSNYSNVNPNALLSSSLHCELQVGMIRVCLANDKVNEALSIFKELSNDVYANFISKNLQPPMSVKSYMTTAHLSFIGFCKDVDTANVFFLDAINGEMPYPTPLQLNFIKKYISNTWEITNDIDKVKKIWIKTWQYYEFKRLGNNSISASLNDLFLSIFFQKHTNYSDESFNKLINIINEYCTIRRIDEPFINVLFSKSRNWNDLKVFNYIFNLSSSSDFVKTNVFYRCCLKACGSINSLDADQILMLFKNLLLINASNGYRGIAHADWTALRDATISSPILLSTENCATSRIDLYYKLWKLCSPYLLSLDDFKNYIYKDIKLNYAYSKIFENIANIRTDDIQLPEIGSYSRNFSIDNYTGYSY
ncbi:hypothetical protein B5S33_g3855 [[Candida] boidinii]|nr:hypothetical protein B5S33_g3855 [[Candida] boidinii]